MRKRFGIFVVALLIGAFAFVPGLGDRCVSFLLIGVVPYTDITLSPTIMLILYALFLALSIFVIASELFVATNPVKRELASRKKARRKVHKLVKSSRAHAQNHTKKRYQSVIEH